MGQFLMRIYKAILASTLLVMGFAVNARAAQVVSSGNAELSVRAFSTESHNTDTVPHRGSGR